MAQTQLFGRYVCEIDEDGLANSRYASVIFRTSRSMQNFTFISIFPCKVTIHCTLKVLLLIFY